LGTERGAQADDEEEEDETVHTSRDGVVVGVSHSENDHEQNACSVDLGKETACEGGEDSVQG